MKGLLVKDFKIIGQQKWLMIIILLCAFLCFYSMHDPSFIVGYTCLICATLCVTTCAYDEMNNGLAFLMAMPYSRKTYIIEKYVLSLIIGCFAWIISSVAAIFCTLILKRPFGTELITELLFFIIPILVIPSLMIPVTYKFGHNRSRIVVFVIIGIVFAIGGVIASLGAFSVDFMKNKMGIGFENFGSMQFFNVGMLLGAGLAVSVIIYIISLIISIKIIEKKEY